MKPKTFRRHIESVEGQCQCIPHCIPHDKNKLVLPDEKVETVHDCRNNVRMQVQSRTALKTSYLVRISHLGCRIPHLARNAWGQKSEHSETCCWKSQQVLPFDNIMGATLACSAIVFRLKASSNRIWCRRLNAFGLRRTAAWKVMPQSQDCQFKSLLVLH